MGNNLYFSLSSSLLKFILKYIVDILLKSIYATVVIKSMVTISLWTLNGLFCRLLANLHTLAHLSALWLVLFSTLFSTYWSYLLQNVFRKEFEILHLIENALKYLKTEKTILS